MKRTIAIGDLHGCVETLKNLLEDVNYNKKTDKLIFLGDYIDRGNHIKETVDYVMTLQNEVGKDKCICLLGNHEYMFINNQIYDYETPIALGEDSKRYKEWFRTLPLYYEMDNFVFVHGGLPKSEIEKNSIDDIVWTYRNDYIYDGEKYLVCGHQPCDSVYMDECKTIGVDTGCTFGYGLSCLIIEEDGTLKTLTTPTDRTDLRYKEVEKYW